MATEEIVPKEVLDAISATCDMITVADKYAMINNNKEFRLVSDVCSVTGDSIKTYDIVLKYSEDANGVKHILAESFGNLVSDITFEQSFEKAIKQSAVAGTIVAMVDSPAPGPADIAGAVVFLGGATKGYVVSKAKAWAAGEFTKESILKLWPDQEEIKAYEDNKSIYEKKDGNITLPNNKEVQESILPVLKNNGVEKVSIDNQPYTIQNGDTLSQIAQANNTTVDSLIESNPWLTEDNRISSDGSYALIKPGEKLNLTVDNKTTSYGIDDTNTLTPEYQIDLTTQDVIPLKENQNISGVAKILGKSEIDLAEYNNLTLENSKSLPTGTPIRSYVGNPEIISTPEGNIKLFKNYDGSETAILPESITGEKIIINFDEDSSTLLYGDRTNPDKITYVDDVTNNYVEISKDSNGSYYKSLESNNDFTVKYDNNKTITNIEITSNNVNLDDIAPLTPYSKEDLKAFNLLDGDMNNFYKTLERKVA
ncbi:hypothetical protein CRV08_04690 [Halarcobacter ebronensis]|uniref:LysM domain-containing protein n=1 Tax=Halarcobacter ebronensis TaxID=1462615 RepID=A0A4Q0YFH5_9BACT|nr:LysM domain-containing protein [Halarcobacter ebronensis]RXJ69310.1 hypothetical protein CRV08_04690 [Halarcobacter ebronensis]